LKIRKKLATLFCTPDSGRMEGGNCQKIDVWKEPTNPKKFKIKLWRKKRKEKRLD
jgi:hypothetical protein